MTWVDGQPWLIANQPIVRSDNTLALLCLGRPLAAALAYAFPPGGEVHVRILRPEESENGQRISLDGVGGPPVWLDVTVEDSARRALAKVKTLLLWLMPGAGLTLLLLLGMTLHRQLKPLAQLTEAVAGVGRGEFAPVPAPPSNNEIARLIGAYNTMTADLAKLRALERRIGQQERLSAIGRMAARIAHDMNNSLTVIQGVAELQKNKRNMTATPRRPKTPPWYCTTSSVASAPSSSCCPTAGRCAWRRNAMMSAPSAAPCWPVGQRRIQPRPRTSKPTITWW